MGLFKMEEDPVDESPSSISTGDKGTIMGDSESDFPNCFSSTLIVPFELTAIVLTGSKRGRDWVCTICIRTGDVAGGNGQSLSSFRMLDVFCLSGFLGGMDGG